MIMTTAVQERTFKVPVGAFTDDVTDDRGRINVRSLARALDLPLSTIAPALAFKVRWLSENPTAQNAQPKAVLLLNAANELAGALGGKKYVVLYLKTAQPDFSGETPADQLKKGRLEFFCGYVDEVVTLRRD